MKSQRLGTAFLILNLLSCGLLKSLCREILVSLSCALESEDSMRKDWEIVHALETVQKLLSM